MKAVGKLDWLIALDFANVRNWCKICHFNQKFFEKLRIEVIQMLFYSLALSQECSNHLGEHNQIRESTNKW